MNTSKISKETILEFLEITRLGNIAVKEAIEENRRLGLPNVFERNGKVYFEMPDGTITTESPFKD